MFQFKSIFCIVFIRKIQFYSVYCIRYKIVVCTIKYAGGVLGIIIGYIGTFILYNLHLPTFYLC